AAFTDDFNVFVFFEMKPNAVAGEGFVIYDQCSNHACLASVNSSCLTRMYGMRMRTSAPPSARLLISNANCALYNCSKRARVFDKPMPMPSASVVPSGNPGPVSSTSISSVLPLTRQRMVTLPGPMVCEKPYLMAFSTIG